MFGERLLKDKIAIDGPVASGKSAVGSLVARALDYAFLDTGIMYRAATWFALDRGVAPNDGTKVLDTLRNAKMEIIPAAPKRGIPAQVLVNGRDATANLRTPEVERAVSAVSGISDVRRLLIAQQREIADQGPIVMVGRDIGNVVIPDAPLKVFLDASRPVRAERRWRERVERGDDIDPDAVLLEIQRRDMLDDQTTPLRPAPGARVLQTDELSLEAVVNKIVALALCRS